MLQTKENLVEALELQFRALDKSEELNGVYRDRATVTDKAIEALRAQVSIHEQIDKVQKANLELLMQEIASLKGGVA